MYLNEFSKVNPIETRRNTTKVYNVMESLRTVGRTLQMTITVYVQKRKRHFMLTLSRCCSKKTDSLPYVILWVEQVAVTKPNEILSITTRPVICELLIQDGYPKWYIQRRNSLQNNLVVSCCRDVWKKWIDCLEIVLTVDKTMIILYALVSKSWSTILKIHSDQMSKGKKYRWVRAILL